MTSGEGGMVVSNSKELIDRIKELREYDNRDRYQIGYNYKMTDIHAAVGLAQLSRIETFIKHRRAIAKRYNQAFNSLGLQLPLPDQGHIYFRYVVGLETDANPWIRSLREQGVGCARPVYLALHRYFHLKSYPLTEKVWKQTLSIPIYPSLTREETKRVIEKFIATFRKLTNDGKNGY
jgi:dTDP-4-amino-4,6-dideoxygalactose transaminase